MAKQEELQPSGNASVKSIPLNSIKESKMVTFDEPVVVQDNIMKVEASDILIHQCFL